MPNNYSKAEVRASSREIKNRTAMSKNIAAIKARKPMSPATSGKLTAKTLSGGERKGYSKQRRDARGRFA